MTFHAGDPVHIVAFGKGVVREVRNAGRYLVEVKGRSMVVDANQLTPVEKRKRGLKSAIAEPSLDIPEGLARGHAPASLDLHGKTVHEAVAALDSFLNDAILAGLAEVRVIHGRSGGRLKAAVHSRLEVLPPVREFRVDSANPGVTVVSL